MGRYVRKKQIAGNHWTTVAFCSLREAVAWDWEQFGWEVAWDNLRRDVKKLVRGLYL